MAAPEHYASIADLPFVSDLRKKVGSKALHGKYRSAFLSAVKEARETGFVMPDVRDLDRRNWARFFRLWVNYYVEPQGVTPMTELYSGLSTGYVLAVLVEVLAGVSFNKVQNPKHKMQTVANFQQIFDYLRKEIGTLSIQAADFQEETLNRDAVLSLLHSISFHFQLRVISHAKRESDVRLCLLRWVQCKVGCFGLAVEKFGIHFKDGQAMLAVAYSLRGDDEASASFHPKWNNRDRLRKAFMILNEDLNVPMLLDDITLSVSSSHDQMVFTFMSLIYRLYSTDEERRGIFDSLKYRCKMYGPGVKEDIDYDIDMPQEVYVELKGGKFDNVKLYPIHRATKEECKSDLIEVNGDKFLFTYTPDQVGEHQIYAKAQGGVVNLNAIPAFVNVVEPVDPEFSVFGDKERGGEEANAGIENAVVGELARIFVEAKQKLNPDQLDIEIRSPSGVLDKKVTYDAETNRFVIEYTPEEEGKHQISLKYKGKDIEDSPYDVQVNDVDPEFSVFGGGEEANAGIENAVVGEPARVFIEAKQKLDPDQLDIEIRSPSGVLDKKVTYDAETNRFVIEYTPEEEGKHQISLKYKGKDIEDSPYDVQVSDVDPEFSVFGDGEGGGEEANAGIENAVVGEPARVFLEAKQKLDPDQLDIEIRSPSGVLDKKVTYDAETNRFVIEYTPEEEGKHQISLKYKGKDIEDSPYDVQVSDVDPEFSVFGGGEEANAGIGNAVIGEPARVFIEAKQKLDPDQLDIEIRSPSGVLDKKVTYDAETNRFVIEYTPEEEGKHQISLKYKGKDIEDSPYDVQVSDVEPEFSVFGGGEGANAGIGNAVIGEPARVFLEAKQKLDPDQLDIEIRSPSGVLDKKVTYDAETNRFVIEYTPEEEGKHQISLKYKGKDIEDSPYDVQVSDVEPEFSVFGDGEGANAGIEDAVIGEPARVFIEAKQKLDPDQLDIEIRSPSGVLDKKVTYDAETNRFVIEYTPEEEGKHQISLKYKGVDIEDSPYDVEVLQKDVEEDVVEVVSDGEEDMFGATTARSLDHKRGKVIITASMLPNVDKIAKAERRFPIFVEVKLEETGEILTNEDFEKDETLLQMAISFTPSEKGSQNVDENPDYLVEIQWFGVRDKFATFFTPPVDGTYTIRYSSSWGGREEVIDQRVGPKLPFWRDPTILATSNVVAVTLVAHNFQRMADVAAVSGGAVVGPMMIFMVLLALPMMVLEVCLGSLTNYGPVKSFLMLHPRFYGIGISLILAALIVFGFEIMIAPWCCLFFVNSFQSPLPWSGNNTDWFANTIEQSPGLLYMDTIAKWSVTPFIFMLFVTLIFFLAGKEEWLNQLGVPGGILLYLVYIACFIRVCLLGGAKEGLDLLFEDGGLASIEIWVEAGAQSLFATAVTWGVLELEGGRMGKWFEPPPMKMLIAIVVISWFTSLSMMLMIFMTLGYMANETGEDLSDVLSFGPELFFSVYPYVVTTFPTGVDCLMSIFTFGTLIILGFVLMAEMMALFVSVIIECTNWPDNLRSKRIGSLITTFFLFCWSLVFTFDGGYWWFYIFDYYCAILCVVIACFIEVVAVGWVYGGQNLCDGVAMKYGSKVPFARFWVFQWKFTVPFICFSLIVLSIYYLATTPYEDEADGFIRWVDAFMWIMSFAPLVPFLIFVFTPKIADSTLTDDDRKTIDQYIRPTRMAAVPFSRKRRMAVTAEMLNEQKNQRAVEGSEMPLLLS